MASVPSPLLIITLLVLMETSSLVSGWKKDEFRNCNQTPFCKRSRTRDPHSIPSLSVSGVSVAEGRISATLLPSASASADDHPPHPLLLHLSVYRGGILRVEIDEDGSFPRRRFRVPDVLADGLDDRRLWISRTSGGPGVTAFYLSDGHTAVLRHEPFELTILRSGASGGSYDAPLLSLNSHGLFDFEQLRNKQEGEDWEERFRMHTDTRPHGPQSISLDVSFHGAEFVYGIPEHGSSSLALRPTRGPEVDGYSEPYRLFNLDVFQYLHDSPFGIYGSIPFMVSHGSQGSSGFFWLNAAEMQVDVLAPGWDKDNSSTPVDKHEDGRIDTLWMAEAGVLDVFLFVGPVSKDVLGQYTAVTGTPAMPNHFAIGYHQCRWNYRDEEDVAAVDAGFDEHDIPYDVLWLDIEHTDGKKYFTWDRTLFPHPVEMQNKIAGKGRRMVTIVDPHIKRDDSYYIHKEATEKGYYVKDASNKNNYHGWCWPGSSSYLDMLDPEVREWWGEQFSLENYKGSTPSLYIWNDMNEPSVFDGPEVTMPRDAIHYGDAEHRELHNAYGYYFHMATSNGLVKRGGGKDRPFVLSRAFFAGSQRYGAVWTGDNSADWDHLKSSVPMILTLGLAGMPFSGADVGGFFGSPETELLVRWYQLGAYYPFFRSHAHHEAKRREPWLFGERNTALIREAIQNRYSLLPYYYSLFREASVTGVPIMRPLWMEFPSDKKAFNEDESFLVGSGLLVQGIYQEGQKSVSVYLPGQESWYYLRNGLAYAGGKSHKLDVLEDSIPTFQRAGTIIPRKDRVRRSSTQMVNDPYTLVISLDSSQGAVGELYVDDGKSYDFEHGAYIHRRFVFADSKLTSIDISSASLANRGFSSECMIERIILLGLPAGKTKAVIEGENREIDIEAGPLSLRGFSSAVAPVIRKPNVLIADDWTIRIL